MTGDGIRALGLAPDGSAVHAITLRAGGLTAQIMTWGATLQDLRIDAGNRPIILGSPLLEPYFTDLRYFGAIVGPVANRISGAAIEFDGRRHRLDANEAGKTTLHGGTHGLGQRVWRIVSVDARQCVLAITQPDGLDGFPGEVVVEATYRLEDDAALMLQIKGFGVTASQFNPAFHGYWALDGAPDLRNHRLTIAAETYLPVDADLIPVSGPAPVTGKFDYRSPQVPDMGLDHTYCLASKRGPLRPVATLSAGDVTMTLETTEPGLQVYPAGGSSSGKWPGHGGAAFGAYAGIALEPQLWPNAPNRPDFPSARIEQGQTITQTSRFRITYQGNRA